jgi:glycosyltransferase involved in cell wall biosynthesis
MAAESLKLLFVVNQLAPIGGAEVQLIHLANGLDGLGHEVTICSIDHAWAKPGTVAAGIESVQLHASDRYRRATALPRLTRLARRADVVQCTMWDPSLWGRLAALAARRPMIVADHATDRSVQITASGAPRARWIAAHNRLLDPFTYATVACASSQLPVLLGEGVAADKVVHIPNGIPLERTRAAAAAAPGRQQLGLPPSGRLVVQVGLFRPEKNQLGALEAFQAVRERAPDAHLVFVGDGPTMANVQRRAGEIGAGEWAHFLGHRSDVPALLAKAELMLLPSVSDAMPMTVIEAMALGVPVLATDVGDVAATLGEGGLCVPVGDPGALAEACLRLLGDDPLRGSMAAVASARSAAYDAAAMVRDYQALFRGALAKVPPQRALRELA